MASEVIGHDPEESADSISASAGDGMAAANGTSDGVLLSETVYYADGTRAGVKTPDDGYWTTRYIGSLIYEGEPGQETLEGVITDVSCIFMQVDPMAEKYYGMTPYGYCINSPINFLDPFGLYSVTGNPPDNLYGTPDYYLWRQEDLYKRGLIASPTVSTYYNDFGYKYACKFLKLSSELSESGKKWVKDEMTNFIEIYSAEGEDAQNGQSEIK